MHLVPLQLMMLGVLFLAIALVLDSAWALLAGTARDWFAPSHCRNAAIGGTGGLVVIGIGASIAANRSHRLTHGAEPPLRGEDVRPAAGCLKFDVRFSITARQDRKVRAAIEAIPEHAWRPIPTPEVSGADVAEVPYTCFRRHQGCRRHGWADRPSGSVRCRVRS
jgi:hypothetical protein